MSVRTRQVQHSHMLNAIAASLARVQILVDEFCEALEQADQGHLAAGITESVSKWRQTWDADCDRAIQGAMDAMNQMEARP